MDFLELQASKVAQVIEKLNSNQETIIFKSPTGSGKTIMLGDIMNKMLNDNPDYVFIVSSLSKGGLAEQNYNSFNKRKNIDCQNLKPYLIKSERSFTEGGNYLPNNKNVYVLPRDLTNSSSRITKDNSLKCLLDNLKNDKSKTIILIKDECHDATNNLDKYFSEYFTKSLLVSATPNKKQVPDVEMTEQEAIAAHLIKEVEYHTEEVPFEKALEKFQKLKKEYHSKIGIEPCLLVQISNEKDGEEEKNRILSILNKTEFSGLHWIYIVGDDEDNETNDDIVKTKNKRLWRKYTKDNLSTIDIVIFKLSLAEGWDIPRACMLYQVRDTSSKTLDEQVIGRVRRNPKLLDFENLSSEAQELISKAYVYGICEVKKAQKIKVQLVDENKVLEEIKINPTIVIPETRTLEIDELLVDTDPNTKPSIFEINKKIESIHDKEVKKKINEYIKDYSDWFKVGYNISNIKKRTSELTSKELNSEVKKNTNNEEIEVSLPTDTAFIATDYTKDISNWVWTRVDGKEEFSFDSESEKEWFEELYKIINRRNKEGKKIGKLIEITDEDRNFLIAKNYTDKSEICFEYYNNGVRRSYPDFVLKDKFDRLHFFESKSLNVSNSQNFDSSKYLEKIEALKDGYLSASKVVPYHFYIPIKENNTWNIFHFHNGEKEEINRDKLEEILKSGD